MAYEKLVLVNKETIFMAEHVSHIEDGIIANEKAISEVKEAVENIEMPCYENVETLYSYWPGDEYLDVAMSSTDATSVFAFKFFEEGLTAEEFIGSVATMTIGDQKTVKEYTSSNVTDAGTYVIAQPFISVFEESVVQGVTLSPGFWVAGFSEESLSAITATLTKTTIKQLDEEFIPEEIRKQLPEVTTADNEKFLQVVNGVWTAVAIADADEGGF